MKNAAVKTMPVIIDGEYDLFGDVEPHEWARQMMAQAKRVGLVKEYKLVNVIHNPVIEILHVRVLIDMVETYESSMRQTARRKLNEVFKDTDCRVNRLVLHFEGDQNWEV